MARSDDDADTPRWGQPRARSQSGEIDVEDSSPEFVLDNETPPPLDLFEHDPRMQRMAEAFWLHVRRMNARARKRAADQVLEVQAAVQKVAPVEKSTPVKKAAIDLLSGLLMAAVCGLAGLLWQQYHEAGQRSSELHDRVLLLEQRETQLERTLGAIVVPHIDPSQFRGQP